MNFTSSKSNPQKHANLEDSELATFRTNLCEKHRSGNCSNSDKCGHSHCQTWQRRNPFHHSYSPKLCPDIEFVKRGTKMSLVRRCNRGRGCVYAHSKEEELYHPLLYKTKVCNAHPNCSRYFCPFAHTLAELRKPSPPMTSSNDKSKTHPKNFDDSCSNKNQACLKEKWRNCEGSSFSSSFSSAESLNNTLPPHHHHLSSLLLHSPTSCSSSSSSSSTTASSSSVPSPILLSSLSPVSSSSIMPADYFDYNRICSNDDDNNNNNYNCSDEKSKQISSSERDVQSSLVRELERLLEESNNSGKFLGHESIETINNDIEKYKWSNSYNNNCTYNNHNDNTIKATTEHHQEGFSSSLFPSSQILSCDSKIERAQQQEQQKNDSNLSLAFCLNNSGDSGNKEAGYINDINNNSNNTTNSNSGYNENRVKYLPENDINQMSCDSLLLASLLEQLSISNEGSNVNIESSNVTNESPYWNNACHHNNKDNNNNDNNNNNSKNMRREFWDDVADFDQEAAINGEQLAFWNSPPGLHFVDAQRKNNLNYSSQQPGKLFENVNLNNLEMLQRKLSTDKTLPFCSQESLPTSAGRSSSNGSLEPSYMFCPTDIQQRSQSFNCSHESNTNCNMHQQIGSHSKPGRLTYELTHLQRPSQANENVEGDFLMDDDSLVLLSTALTSLFNSNNNNNTRDRSVY